MEPADAFEHVLCVEHSRIEQIAPRLEVCKRDQQADCKIELARG